MVSGKKSAVKMTASKDTAAAIIKGMAGLMPTVSAEMAGPKINPNENDAPIMPNPLARFFGSVVSEITADATGIFPAVMPSSARAIKIKIALGANAIMAKEITVPAMDAMSSGFLPNLSDNRPIIGVERNWQMEKRENNRPFWKSVRPNRWEYEYRIGIS